MKRSNKYFLLAAITALAIVCVIVFRCKQSRKPEQSVQHAKVDSMFTPVLFMSKNGIILDKALRITNDSDIFVRKDSTTLVKVRSKYNRYVVPLYDSAAKSIRWYNAGEGVVIADMNVNLDSLHKEWEKIKHSFK